MPDNQWKRTERRIAKMVGGKRTGPPVPGEPDVRSPWLSIEVKERRQLPTWIKLALLSARIKAKGKQLGILVLHETGTHDDLIVISRRDFTAWFGWQKKGG